MTNKDKLIEMLNLQQKLNDETNGEGWENGYTKQNRLINWRRCIYMELAELIDSFNWKHWKDINIEPDWENVKIEVVDIWHFVLSLALEEYKLAKKGNIEDIANYILETQHFPDFENEPRKTHNEDIFMIINTIEHFIKDTIDGEKFSKLIDDFLEVALQCGLNIDILYKFYIAKNILNQFRQNHGYKDGTYIKEWDGKEDNVVMLEILEDRLLNAKELYHELEKNYPTKS